jgi:hypothetical protein
MICIVAFSVMDIVPLGTALFLISGYLLTVYLIFLYSEHHPKTFRVDWGQEFAHIQGLQICRSEIDDVTIGRQWIEVRWLSRETGASSILIRQRRVREQSWEDLTSAFHDFKFWWQVEPETETPNKSR